MRVFNISDVETPALRAAQRVNLPVTVSGKPLPPGESTSTSALTTEEARWVAAGVLVTGALPAWYLEAKEDQPASAPPPPMPATLPPPPESVQELQVAPRGEETVVPVSEEGVTGDTVREETQKIETSKKGRRKKRGR